MLLPHLVSVIIPARNAQTTIASSINSVLKQDYRSLEVIVVDDKSTDQTVRIAESTNDPRVRVVLGNGHGAAAARNLGLNQSRGEYIQFLDADDLLSPNKLQLQIYAIQNTSNVASCAWFHLRQDGKLYKPNDVGCWQAQNAIDWLRMSLSGEGMMQTGCWLIPRHIAEKAGPWDESLTLHDDGEYFCRVLLASTGNRFVEDCYVEYRVMANSLSKTRTRSSIESAYRVCESREEKILAYGSTHSIKRSIATQWAQFAYEFQGQAPDLALSSLTKIRNLHAQPHNVVGGRYFRLTQKVFGWKVAFALHRLAHKIKG